MKKSVEETGETPFNHVMSVDVEEFVHWRALCNSAVGNTCWSVRKWVNKFDSVKEVNNT